MKKIIAIIIIGITMAVTAFNIYQAIPQFIVKPDTHERVEVKDSERDGSNKGPLAAYITFNLICLAFFLIKYAWWNKVDRLGDGICRIEKTTFYHDCLSVDGWEFGSSIVFIIFCLVNGFVIFGVISWLIYLLL